MHGDLAFIAAMRIEIRPFLRRVVILERGRAASFPCFRFRLCGRECLLVQSGVGIERAMNAARACLSLFKPSLLVSFGVAGAPGDGLRVGDVIGARAVFGPDGAAPSRALARLSKAAEEAAALALEPRGAGFYPGTAVTTLGAQGLPPAARGALRPVLEMETAGIAEIALEAGIPLLSLRAVSDCPAEPLPFDLEGSLDETQNIRMGKVVAGLLRHPSRIPLALRAGRNAVRAAENLAVAMIAALERHLSGA